MSTKYANVRQIAALFAIFVFWVLPAWAWPPTWGAEFEITRPGVLSKNFDRKNPGLSAEKQMQMDFVAEMRVRCALGKCRIEKIRGKYDDDYKVIFPDGWWFKVSYDPGCVEITHQPSTIEVLKRKAALINEQIFGTGRAIGAQVRSDKNSHVNFGVNSAFDNAQEFLRFYVDYANHPELVLGSLGAESLLNAPPLSALKPQQRTALKRIVNGLRSHRFNSIQDVVVAITDEVYTHTYSRPPDEAFHYQAVGLKYLYFADLVNDDGPVELRSVWIQDSAERLIKVAKLLEARMLYLKNLDEPILYTASTRTNFDASELKTRFAIYVAETGRPFSDYADLLPQNLQSVPLDAFFDKAAPITDRLRSIARYRDLLLTSPWARKRTLEILGDPLALGNPALETELEALSLNLRARAVTDEQFTFNKITRSIFENLPAKTKGRWSCRALLAK